jgi:hypothetical protein
MTAYDPAAWEGFAVGVVGAAAALAGLLVVAGSINISRIMESQVAIAGLGLTLVLFALVLVVGVVLLTPEQGHRYAGLEIAAAGGLAIGAVLVIRRRPGANGHRAYAVSAVVMSLVDAGIFVLAGLGCAFATLGGLYWLGHDLRLHRRARERLGRPRRGASLGAQTTNLTTGYGMVSR